MALTNIQKIQLETAPKRQDDDLERWWWDEIGVLVEHEVWHLPQIAEEQRQG